MDCSHIKLIAELNWNETESSIAHSHIDNVFWGKKIVCEMVNLSFLYSDGAIKARGHCPKLTMLDLT